VPEILLLRYPAKTLTAPEDSLEKVAAKVRFPHNDANHAGVVKAGGVGPCDLPAR